MDFIVYSIIVFIGVFGALGIYLVVRTLRSEARNNPRPGPGGGPIRRLQAYVGETRDSNALLSPPLRVALEFFLAFCGFPGIGWLASGQLAIGLVLLATVPSLVWAVAPVLMAANGAMFRDPFATVRFLPVIAILSASGLAAHEVARARRMRGQA
jgi:uncharacterized protein YneF (UPF0154 family)